MRVLLAPDDLGGLGRLRVADLAADAWLAAAPNDTVLTIPLTDGGPGTVEALHASTGGRVEVVVVPGPDGAPRPASLLVLPGAAGPTVVIEAAQVLGSGVPLVQASSFGLGRLVAAALALGPARLVVALGGVATHDAGAGLLAGLGLASPRLVAGAVALTALGAADVAGAADVRARLAGVEVLAAADVDLPLLGLAGAAAVLGLPTALGALGSPVGAEQAQDLERGCGHLVQLLGGELGPGAVRAAAQLPGAGAGGGLGFVLAALGAQVGPGSDVVAELAGVPGAVGRADLVVSLTSTLDRHVLHGSVVATVARHALATAVPVVVVAGELAAGRREWGAAGISGAYPVLDDPADASWAERPAAVAARVARVARTWSR